jgi:hypothetical protein
MARLLFVVVAASLGIGMIGAAFAADLPQPAPPPQPYVPPPPPVYTGAVSIWAPTAATALPAAIGLPRYREIRSLMARCPAAAI